MATTWTEETKKQGATTETYSSASVNYSQNSIAYSGKPYDVYIEETLST